MKELNDEIKLTLDLMQGDIDDGAHSELRYHLACLMGIKRNEIQQRLVKPAKPLTTEELRAGVWWCDDVSEDCANAFIAKGLPVFNSSDWGDDGMWVGCVMGAFGEVKRRGLFFDFAGKKQIYRIGNDFYWSEK